MAALLIGYARCSTDQQDLTAQRDGLAALGVADNRVCVDHGLTGTNRERPALCDRYLALYYDGDTAVASDAKLVRWVDELNRLMSSGVGDELTGDLLGRVCATLIHVSTVERDILNNVVWDYTTLGWVTPTVVPLTGEPMDQRRSFDLLATLIGT